MSRFQIQVWFYRYRDSPALSSSSSTSSSSSSTCSSSSCTCTYTYLESPDDDDDTSDTPGSPGNNNNTQILIRERRGISDNHVQWISPSAIEAVSPFQGMSWAHGVVRCGDGVNDVGQMLWLRSDQALQRGQTSCPAVNLELLRSVEVRIRDVTWRADKKEKANGCARMGDGSESESESMRARNRGREEPGVCFRGPLTLAGPEYRHGDGKYRMCLGASGMGEDGCEDGCEDGILEMVTIEDMERYYEDV